MKTIIVLAAGTFLTGCISKHNLPPNSFMQGVTSKISTPWGSHELVIDMAATGEAAKNISLPESPAPKKK